MGAQRPQAALVTGGARRIGRAIAEGLADDGYHVFVHFHRSRDEAERVVAGIAARGGRAEAVNADLENVAQVEALVAACRRPGLALTCLVNSASHFEFDAAPSFEAGLWDRHAAVNLRAPALLARDLARDLPADHEGCIVNLVDHKVSAPNPDFFSYTLSKIGLSGLTRVLALGLAPRVRVNGIAPGVTLPSPAQTPEGFARAQRLSPLGRGTSPAEIVAALRFILACPSLTGQVLTLDGGQFLQPLARDAVFLTEDRTAREPR
jgi:NAD(P)-dependent dehydrogenase (short-subunit alcohol dehydrogenase family)